MDIHRYPWISMDIHGYPWISMDIQGYPEITRDLQGYPSIFMDIHVYLWISMNIHGYPWISTDIHGDLWISVAIHGLVQSYMTCGAFLQLPLSFLLRTLSLEYPQIRNLACAVDWQAWRRRPPINKQHITSQTARPNNTLFVFFSI